MNKKKKIIIGIVVAIVALIIGVVVWYNVSLSPVKKNELANEEGLVRVEIPEGYGINKISKLLKDKGVIKNELALKLHIKLNNKTSLKAGKYDFNINESAKQIIDHVVNGEVTKEEIKITFVEGKNMRSIAKTIASKTNNTEEDVFNLLKDKEYINSLIEKYWFLTDEIQDDRIYYPLEGYLLPDTYIFENKEVDVKTIFNIILNYTDKYLSKYKDIIEQSDLTMHQVLTLASMAELEGKTLEDREEIIGVFFNRLDKGMTLGSDVTTYYAFKVDMGDRNLTKKEIATENPYNTRVSSMAGKIPVGPICNPSKEAIEATFNWKETDAYYFVADKNGKVYFTRNNDEHLKKIRELKDDGLWFVYN